MNKLLKYGIGLIAVYLLINNAATIASLIEKISTEFSKYYSALVKGKNNDV